MGTRIFCNVVLRNRTPDKNIPKPAHFLTEISHAYCFSAAVGSLIASLSIPSFFCGMFAAGLVLLATLAYTDGNRVYAPVHLATEKVFILHLGRRLSCGLYASSDAALQLRPTLYI
eukprot:s2944_g14.t1